MGEAVRSLDIGSLNVGMFPHEPIDFRTSRCNGESDTTRETRFEDRISKVISAEADISEYHRVLYA